VRSRLISLDDPRGWRTALAGVPHAFGHTWDNCHAIALTTGYRTHLFEFEADETRVVCPIAERPVDEHVDIVTPYGFSGFTANGECPRFPEVWRAFVDEQRWVCGYVSVHPLVHRGTLYQPEDACRQVELYLLDLRGSVSAVSSRFDANRARELRAWTKRAEPVVADRDALADFVVAEHEQFFSSRGASEAYRFAEATWRSLLQSESVVAVGAATGGRVVAVTTFGYTTLCGEFLFNVCVPEGRSFSTALLWEGMLALKQRGVPMLNLGGGVRPGDGVAQYKQRFRPTTMWSPALCQVYAPEVYVQMCRQSGADPGERTGYFPAYRRAMPLPTRRAAEG
jgi:hypothetical protein